MSRTLGVDLGERRIGIAIADPGGRARPHVTLRRSRNVERDAEALRDLVAGQAVQELVVGLPLDLDGREGDQARRTRSWATAIGAALGIRVSLADERLTSHVAEGRVGPMPRGRSGGPPTAAQRDRHRARVDREAATVILQDELDRRASRSPSAPRDPESDR